ncbi:MAG: SAM-dependent methyltransferase [Bacteroidetes bacterium]|nr:SAM-dependent methyltransferase [Bacteroidota bacterium]
MLDLARKYAWYYLNAKSKQNVESPFVLDLITEVLEDKNVYDDYAKVEKVRLGLLNNRLVTEVEDFGAGGVAQSIQEKRVSEIAAKSVKPARWGKLLYRICRYFEVRNMLEFGTSLGVTTAYQALGALQKSESIHFVSMEGSKNLVNLAQINLDEVGAGNKVNLVQGDFDHTLEKVLKSFDQLDYVFVDGNHRKEPTLRYFMHLLPKMHAGSVIVFDDIYWSREMSDAWEEIKAHPSVTLSIDLFYIGMVFFREQEPEHLVLKF